MDLSQLAHALGVATGRRELAERIVGELRRSVAGWRVADTRSVGLLGAIRAAFYWAVTERWCARIEGIAAQMESDLAQLRTAEQTARSSYEQALRAPPPLAVLKKSRGR